MKVADGFVQIAMSMTSAKDFLYLLNRPKDALKLQGTWDVSDLHQIRQRLLRLKSIGGPVRKEMLLVIEGAEDEYVSAVINKFLHLIKGAIERNANICFN